MLQGGLTFFRNILPTFCCWLILVLLLGRAPVSFAQQILPDTAKISLPDTSNKQATRLVTREITAGKAQEKKFTLNSIIDYASADSIVMDIKQKKAWLYHDAAIKYEDISLKAYLVVIDFATNTVHAYAGADSTGKEIGTPEFTQGSLTFKAKELSYNFNSKKGFIKQVVTKEGEGYIHGSAIKRINENVTMVGKGAYTTCDLPTDPHFSLKYSKAKIINGDKIITGPAYIDVEGVPLPVVLPFGLFPNKRGRASGIIPPSWGESANRGFRLENGGYYFGINDHIDLKLLGDIYSRGSWAIKPTLTYQKRYKYAGSFNFSYAVNLLGSKGTSDYSKNKDFFVTWSHRQDAKARPNSVFSASVNAGSSKYNSYNPASVNNYLNNNFSSSISYDLRMGQFGNLTASARHSQNISTHNVTLNLPDVSFGINRIYPFKRKVQTGKARWYESINVTYSMNASNQISTADSLLFDKNSLKNFSSGIKHSIPLTGTFKVLKYFSWNNSFNYNERWYTRTIRKTWIGDTTFSGNDTILAHVDIDTVNEFRTARDYSFNTSLGTTLYGMKTFRHGPLVAIRHVVRPSFGFSYTPDFSIERLGYYRTVQVDTAGKTEKYSIFGGSGTFSPIYGYPGSQKSGSINFGLGNSLEMKVKSKKDTITGVKKVMLIESFNLGTSYNLAADSMNWSPLSVSARTTLFKKLQISYNASYSCYATDSKGKLINEYEYKKSGYLYQFRNSNWNLSAGWDLHSKDKPSATPKNSTPGDGMAEQLQEVQDHPERFLDWNNTWNLRFNYSLGYTSGYNYHTNYYELQNTFIQTLGVSGDFNFTNKWKVSMQTGYDFKNKDFSFTQMSITRDLHCWEMRFNWVPFGQIKSWDFQINARSSLLKDLKLTRKKDFRDNY